MYNVAIMGEVSVREFKNRLSEHLRRLENGETITVTRRGRPVAIVMPVEPQGDRLTARLRELVARGVIQWSGGKPKGLNPPIKLRGEGPTASEMVLEDRR
jgi:prevent-host-death family protein